MRPACVTMCVLARPTLTSGVKSSRKFRVLDEGARAHPAVPVPGRAAVAQRHAVQHAVADEHEGRCPRLGIGPVADVAPVEVARDRSPAPADRTPSLRSERAQSCRGGGTAGRPQRSSRPELLQSRETGAAINDAARPSSPLAAWVVQACGVVGNIARRAAASLFNGADGILGTVRELVAVEYQRLLEANEVGVGAAREGFWPRSGRAAHWYRTPRPSSGCRPRPRG